MIEASGVDDVSVGGCYLVVNQKKIYIDGGQNLVSVYSLNGKEIGRYEIGSSITLDSGIYVLRSGAQNRKIIIEKP